MSTKSTRKLSLVACSLLIFSPAMGSGLQSFSLDVEPWGFKATGSGISPEFLQFLASKAGVSIETKVYPYVRAIRELEDGGNALIMAIPNPDRDAIADRLCQPTELIATIAYRKEAFPEVPDLKMLSDKQIGVLRGSRTLDKISETIHYNKYHLGSMTQGFKMLDSNRLDGTVCLRPGCTGAIVASGMDARKIGDLIVEKFPMVVYFSKANPLARNTLAIQKMKEACESEEGKGLMRNLLLKYD